jgi:hypothetical protein
MKRKLPDEMKPKVDVSLDAGLGVGLYRDGDRNDYLVSYGRGGDLGYTYPPANYGSASLIAYCPPEEVVDERVSPLLRNRDVIPQIHLPARAPARTVYPDIRS